MNTTEKAGHIRKTLKQYGITSKQVSVRSKYFSGGSSIDLNIKDMLVDFQLVESIAQAQEKIDRCEVTQEILSGGNTYVHTQYDWKIKDAFIEELKVTYAKEIETLEKEGDVVIGNYSIKKSDSYNKFFKIDNSGASIFDVYWGYESILFEIAVEEQRRKQVV